MTNFLDDDENIIKYLVDNSADINAKADDGQTPMHIASFYDHEEVVKFLILKGANIEATDNYGSTPLHAAIDAHRNILKI